MGVLKEILFVDVVAGIHRIWRAPRSLDVQLQIGVLVNKQR